MQGKRLKIYWFLGLSCLSGYVWIALLLRSNLFSEAGKIHLCLMKTISGLPCPSCGTSRSLLALVNGDWKRSVFINPLGVIAAFLIGFVSAWMLSDLIQKKDSLASAYLRVEKLLMRRQAALPLAGLVVANWIWNIYKGL